MREGESGNKRIQTRDKRQKTIYKRLNTRDVLQETRVRKRGEGATRKNSHLLNVGNSWHILVMSPNNESLKKKLPTPRQILCLSLQHWLCDALTWNMTRVPSFDNKQHIFGLKTWSHCRSSCRVCPPYICSAGRQGNSTMYKKVISKAKIIHIGIFVWFSSLEQGNVLLGMVPFSWIWYLQYIWHCELYTNLQFP